MALNNLGVVAYGQGDLARASSCYGQALAIYRAQGDQSGIGLSLHNLAETARDGGDPVRAGALWRESLELRAAQGDRAGVAASLAGLAGVATAAGLTERAARMLGQADRLQREVGLPMPAQERGGQERAIAALRAKMQAGAFSTAWAEGAAMGVEEAVADVVAGAADTEQAAARAAAAEADKSAAVASGLTRRELEVLRLLVDGNSDKEIGDALFISHRTAMTHVQNLLGKLGVNSRTAAAAQALRSGLV